MFKFDIGRIKDEINKLKQNYFKRRQAEDIPVK